jgi:type VI secretion system protein ImpH
MGAEERQPHADLSGGAAASPAERAEAEQRGVLAAYETRAREFDFYRLVYLLERTLEGSAPLGHAGSSSAERIRLRAEPSLTFASSDVSAIARRRFPEGVERVQVSTTFLGLYGSVSPMPAHFVEDIALQVHQGGPQPIREFLDVFHHRLLSLVYRAWAKYRQSVGYARAGKDRFSRRMFCAVGLDGFSDAERAINPFYFLRFAPLLATKSRSARGLQIVLDELLGGIGVHIDQFVGHWTLIEKPLRNKLGVANHQLGESLVIGRYVYDGSGRFTVKLGPLEYDDYLSFLPGGHRRPFLQSVVNTFTPGIHDVMLQLHVDLDAAPRFQLGSPRAATLARTAWLGGTSAQTFSITVPLADRAATEGDEEEDDRGEPPPLP